MTKSALTRPTLILFYGYPGAGKTFLARQLSEDLQAAHVQSDRIRFELFDQPRYDRQENQIVDHLMHYMTEEFLSAGISVLYDINAARTIQRRDLRELARKHKAEVLLLWLQIDQDSAYTRVSKRDRRKHDDKYSSSISRSVFEQQAGSMQNPLATEEYMVISGKHTYQTQRSAVLKKLYDNGLLLTGSAGAKVKPGLVNLVPSQVGGRFDTSRRNISIR